MEKLYSEFKRWWINTFTKLPQTEAILAKLYEEMDELVYAVRRYESGKQKNSLEINEEIADVTLVLFQLAQKYGVCYNSFVDHIRIKHEINKKRTWVQMPDGRWKHLPDDVKVTKLKSDTGNQYKNPHKA